MSLEAALTLEKEKVEVVKKAMSVAGP